MEKYLIFIDGADDAAMYPASRLLGMTIASNATILMKFESSVGGGTGAEHDSVSVTCTADTELKVFKSIAEAINGNNFSPKGFVVVADDVSGVYVDSDITACAITLDS
tara:strand:- start:311 stop:634 length:324 start_codon:yes stop_codon:yes gene_type:complete